MRNRMFGIAVILASCTASATVNGAPMVTYDGGPGFATGILNLTVNATSQNVHFVGGSYDSVFAASEPEFLGDEVGANAAANAIMDVLNGEPTVPEIAVGTSEVLWVPYELVDAGNFLTEQRGHDTDAAPWQSYADFYGSRTTDFSGPPHSWLFATFTPVPEPTSATLLGLGLGVLGIARRKRCRLAIV